MTQDTEQKAVQVRFEPTQSGSKVHMLYLQAARRVLIYTTLDHPQFSTPKHMRVTRMLLKYTNSIYFLFQRVGLYLYVQTD